MVTEARRQPLPRKRYIPNQAVGALTLVTVVLVWLAINFIRAPSDFAEIFLIGFTTGAIYGLVALGYTLVYGILELINFAHGDVFMLGAMMAA